MVHIVKAGFTENYIRPHLAVLGNVTPKRLILLYDGSDYGDSGKRQENGQGQL